MTDKELSSLSYINKDFNTNYKEFLEYVKKLSPKWDPTISNESDPGVLFIKLAAILVDKCSYNIDKNILENFPVSVAQLANARQIFSQLGAPMNWYRSAKGSVTMWWADEEKQIENITDPLYVVIPALTSLTDTEGSVSYATTESVKLLLNGTKVTVPVIEGVVSEYQVNGVNLITTENLAENRRLYFTETSIAENGIFFTDENGNIDTDWHRVDNISSEAYNSKVYEFGVSRDGFSCYIEFPFDVDNLFGKGVYIKYIISNGEAGNISRGTLQKFSAEKSYSIYTSTADTTSDTQQTVVLDAGNVGIQNVYAINNGQDPEDINSAYLTYKSTVGTFKTLVALRDYENAFRVVGQSLELIGNCFATDRTCDPQFSYKIVGEEDGVVRRKNFVAREEIETDVFVKKLSAFDLKIYALQYVPEPQKEAGTSGEKTYDSSFTVVSSTNLTTVENEKDIEDYKNISADYKPITPADISQNGDNSICFIKNYYDISCTVIPQNGLSSSQADDIKANIQKALFREYNSSKVAFGEPVSFDSVYDTILAADSRIKAISLENITYNPVAYSYIKTGEDSQGNPVGEWQEIELRKSRKELPPDTLPPDERAAYVLTSEDKLSYEVYSKSCLAGRTPFLQNIDTNFTYSASQDNAVPVMGITGYIDNIVGANMYFEHTFTPDDAGKSYELKENEHVLFYAPNYIDNQSFSIYTKYQFHLNQNFSINAYPELNPNASWVTLDNPVTFVGKLNETTTSLPARFEYETLSGILGWYVNDTPQNPADWGITVDGTPTEGNFFVITATDTIPANATYRLKEGESICFYLRADDNSPYEYYYYGEGNIITPTMPLTSNRNVFNGEYIGQLIVGTDFNGTKSGIVSNTYSAFGNYFGTYNEFLQNKVTGSYNVISGSNTITTKKKNTVVISDGSEADIPLTGTKFYFQTDKTEKEGDQEYYVLFEAGESQHLLQENEFLMYDYNTTIFPIVMAGTLITRTGGLSNKVRIKVHNFNVDEDTANSDSEIWQALPDSIESITLTETTFYSVGSGSKLTVEGLEANTSFTLTNPPEGFGIDFKVGDNWLGASFEYDGETTALPTIDTGDGWRVCSYLDLNVSSTKKQQVLEGQVVEFLTKDYHIFTDSTSISDLKISAQDITVFPIPPVPWEFTCAVIAGDEEIEVVWYKSGVEVVIEDYGITYTGIPNDGDSISVKQSASGDAPYSFYADSYYNLSGGRNIHTVRYNSKGEQVPMAIYSYTEKQSDNDIEYSDTSVRVTADGGKKTFDLYLPYNKFLYASQAADIGLAYFFTIEFDSKVEDTVSVIVGNAYEIGGGLKKRHFFVIYPAAGLGEDLPTEVTLEITSGVSYTISQLTLADCFLEIASCWKNIMDACGRYDYKINYYDYFYLPPTSERIDDPLVPSSYFDRNHPFNKNTIPQIRDISIKVLGVSGD